MQPNSSLNYIVAFIQPFQLDSVVDALRSLPRFPGMSVSDVQGFGAHKAHSPRAGEATEVHAFKRKVRIEIFCLPSELVAIIEAIRKAAHTGNAGDGKVFAGPVTLAYRIRTAEWGEGAILTGQP
jgi:nitrogen regulatory protein PII